MYEILESNDMFQSTALETKMHPDITFMERFMGTYQFLMTIDILTEEKKGDRDQSWLLRAQTASLATLWALPLRSWLHWPLCYAFLGVDGLFSPVSLNCLLLVLPMCGLLVLTGSPQAGGLVSHLPLCHGPCPFLFSDCSLHKNTQIPLLLVGLSSKFTLSPSL